ncbi:MAG: twin-arginine translocation signal domain-containing protein, partial [Anaerolineae bacterium]|nr:twin-arginine translocation signal domain-containing protein [Anaerolineae bacterium]
MSRTHKPSSMSRRDFLKATGLAAAGLSIGSALSLGQQPLTVSAQGTTVLDLYHDKSSWAPNADKVGEASAKAINIGF